MTNAVVVQPFQFKPFYMTRSNKRTKELHKEIADYLLNVRVELQECSIHYEYNLNDAYGDTFNVDIAFINQTTNQVVLVVLCKCYASSFLKNIYNYFNTTVGEITRLFGRKANADIPELLFVDVTPKQTALFFKAGGIKALETIFCDKIKARLSNHEEVIKEIASLYDKQVNKLTLWYEIPNLSTYAHKSDMESFTIIEVECST